MKVIVLGAGVIGVTTAYFLAKEGHDVVVIDANPAAARSCSYANGGQLSYSHIETWAQSTKILNIIKNLLKRDSFLSYSDFFNKDFFVWFYKFCCNSTKEKALQNSKNLFCLSSYSSKVMKQILSDEPDLKFDYKNNGILHFYRSKKLFELAQENLQEHKEFGITAQVLNAEECVKKEPTLTKLFDDERLAGGIFYPDDASGNCAAFTHALERICEEKYNVIFHYKTEIKNIFTNHKKITGINTNNGVFTADEYVYALGATGTSLLRGIGIEPQIYPLKGYSLSIKSDVEFVAPKLALTDPENKIVYSRIGNIFRAAGGVEICGFDNHKNNRHIEFLKNIVRGSFSDFGNINQVSEWFGFRPFRPNSLPLICQVKKYGNLFLNSGHGSLGFTLSAASGKIIADLLAKRKQQKFAFLEEEEAGIYQ